MSAKCSLKFAGERFKPHFQWGTHPAENLNTVLVGRYVSSRSHDCSLVVYLGDGVAVLKLQELLALLFPRLGGRVGLSVLGTTVVRA